MADNVNVGIPKKLYEKIEKRLEGTEFSSVSDYVAFVLTELMVAEAQDSGTAMSAQDDKKVKDRLKSLGYMD